jgi:SPP1 gp7 family putative phage head morphogenesis protein
LGNNLVATIQKLDVDDMSQLTRRELTKLISVTRNQQLHALTKAVNIEMKEYAQLAGMQSDYELSSINRQSKELSLKRVKHQVAFNLVLAEPLSATGDLLEPFMAEWTRSAAKQSSRVIRNSWAEGKTLQETVRAIRGTRARKFKDGIIAVNQRHAEAVVRTATQHVASTARSATWNNNADIIVGYRWLSTLDQRTTHICTGLDQQVFKLGKGPLPPAHIQCRSTTVAELPDDFKFLEKGATRSAVGGPVRSDMSYYEWLKTQDKEFQIVAIGKGRTEMLNSGRLSAKRFGELQLSKNLSPLTLVELEAEMKKLGV